MYVVEIMQINGRWRVYGRYDIYHVAVEILYSLRDDWHEARMRIDDSY